jgi:D-alanyl-lipoteichoic acid acyltransferase DltB (MBOAT superfamily)
MVFLSILKSLSLGVWLGALIMLGYAVAGPIFQQLPSKTLAGAVNGVILSRMNRMEWACAIVALASSCVLFFLKWNDGSRTLRLTETAAIFVAMILLWIYSGFITDRMNALRSTIGDFDHPQKSAQYIEAKSEFDGLHHRYTALVSANMILILGGFILSMVNSRK